MIFKHIFMSKNTWPRLVIGKTNRRLRASICLDFFSNCWTMTDTYHPVTKAYHQPYLCSIILFSFHLTRLLKIFDMMG